MARDDVTSKVESLLDEYLDGKELELYMVVYKKEGPDWILRVFLDKPADSDTEYVSIDECEKVTRFLSDKLDEMDFIERTYKLEVSSPGLDRELIKNSDYERFAGREVEVKTYEQINGSKNFQGKLISKDGDIVKIEVNDSVLELSISKISKINLAVVF